MPCEIRDVLDFLLRIVFTALVHCPISSKTFLICMSKSCFHTADSRQQNTADSGPSVCHKKHIHIYLLHYMNPQVSNKPKGCGIRHDNTIHIFKHKSV